MSLGSTGQLYTCQLKEDICLKDILFEATVSWSLSATLHSCDELCELVGTDCYTICLCLNRSWEIEDLLQ